MSGEMNEMNNKQVTSEELETVNGGIGLSVCKVPPRHWEKKRGKSFLPTYEPVDVPVDEPKDGGATGSW